MHCCFSSLLAHNSLFLTTALLRCICTLTLSEDRCGQWPKYEYVGVLLI